MDLSNITFNKDHKLETAAKDAATGIKLLALAFFLSLAAIGTAIYSSQAHSENGFITFAIFASSSAAFVSGAYGAYLAASALGWSGLITGAVVLGAIIPYLKFICFIFLLVNAFELIGKANYKFSLFGPLRKRQVA